MYMRGVLSSSYEERGQIAVLHIMEEDVAEKIAKYIKLKKYKTVYDYIECEYLLVTGELDKIRNIMSKQPKNKEEYFTMLRGAVDASCAAIYADRMDIPMKDKNVAKELRVFLTKQRINSSVIKDGEGAILRVKGHSLDKLAGILKNIKGISGTIDIELKAQLK